MSKRYPLSGIADSVEYGKGGARIRSSGGKLQVKNPGDTLLANMQGLDAVAAEDFVTFSQFQAGQAGLSWKDPTQYATVVALSPTNTITGGGATLTATGVGILTVDGDATLLGDEILVKNEGDGIKNGIYTVTVEGTAGVAYELTRRSDLELGADAASIALFVQEGVVNLDTAFTCTNNQGSAVVGTDALVFILFSSVVSGVTGVADAAGVSGETVIVSGSAPVPTFKGIEAGTSITVSTVTDDVVIAVTALGIGTTEIAGVAVTEAKIAPLAGTFTRRVAFGFADTGTNVNIGAALPANAVVTETKVKITTAFDVQTDMSVGLVASPALLLRTADIAEQVIDLYIGDSMEDGAASGQLILQIQASAAVAGAGFCDVEFIVTT